MLEQGFISNIEKMTAEQGARVLLGGAWRKWLADYMRNQYTKETALLKQILEAGCADYIDNADNVLERKEALLVRLEDDPGISPKKSAEYLDLLGMILKGDTSKCGLQSIPAAAMPQPPAPTPLPGQAILSAEELYQQGEVAYNSRDYTKAVKLFREAADQGHAEAQCILGVCYENGSGVTQDYTTAVVWFRKAADQGYAEAQCLLGVCYENGTGVAQDYAKAAEWHRKAAEQGHTSAQFLLGVCYGNGDGVAQDHTKAAEWFGKAAEQGHAMAQCVLGGCYEFGNGVAQDYVKAAEWYGKAADQGYAEAQNALIYLKTAGII